MEEGRAVPLLLQQAVEAGGFYRVKDGRLQYLTVAGDYAKVERGEGVLLLADVKLKGSPLAKSGSASLWDRSEEHTSELQSLMRISYAVFCLKKKTIYYTHSS